MIDLRSLPRLGLSEHGRLPNCMAVYFVLSDTDEVLYIGRTESLVIRWRQHVLKPKLEQLTGVSIAWIETGVSEIKKREQMFIKYFRPLFNTRIEGEHSQGWRNPVVSGVTTQEYIETLDKAAEACRRLGRKELNTRSKVVGKIIELGLPTFLHLYPVSDQDQAV